MPPVLLYIFQGHHILWESFWRGLEEVGVSVGTGDERMKGKCKFGSGRIGVCIGRKMYGGKVVGQWEILVCDEKKNVFHRRWHP